MEFFRLSILFCMLLSAPSCLWAASPNNIFILAGQSNMAGRGGEYKGPNGKFVWDNFIPPESQSNPSILRLSANNQWVEAHEPLHDDIDIGRTCGIGPGMPFAHQLVAKAGSRAGVVGLVPCAHGGSFIGQWGKGTPFYNQLITRITTSDKEGGTVRALFWIQGESDAADQWAAHNYKDRLKKFFTDIRNDIKPRTLPIILVKITSGDPYPYMREVREAQEAVHQELPDVQIMDAADFVKVQGGGFNSDHVHLNRNSQIAFGKALADTYLSHYGQSL